MHGERQFDLPYLIYMMSVLPHCPHRPHCPHCPHRVAAVGATLAALAAAGSVKGAAWRRAAAAFAAAAAGAAGAGSPPDAGAIDTAFGAPAEDSDFDSGDAPQTPQKRAKHEETNFSNSAALALVVGTLERLYASQFQRAGWCADALALSLGPTLRPAEAAALAAAHAAAAPVPLPAILRRAVSPAAATECAAAAAAVAALGVRARMHVCAEALAAAAAQCRAYATSDRDQRAVMLGRLAGPAAAAYEYAAEIGRAAPRLRDLAAGAPGGAAACAAAVAPVLLVNAGALVAFIGDELSTNAARRGGA